jgi:hypothetical protein
MNNKELYNIANYCVSFIDLLGQRLEYKDEGLVPEFKSAEEKEKFINNKLRNTIGRIITLQHASDSFVKAALENISPQREELQPDVKRLNDEMKEVRLKQQRWSDGLFYFISLMEGNVKCPMVGVYTVLSNAGSLCFVFLAGKLPLRGSIDIAWAAELYEGELYGAAVAKAYELESQVAQYPRIVVGQRVIDYLIDNMNNPASDIYRKYNRNLAKICYDMLAQDSDGYHFVHYLGDVFHKMVTKSLHKELYQNSMKFVLEQCKKWKDEQNTKLSFRYNHLLSYFLAHPPSESQEENTQPSFGH